MNDFKYNKETGKGKLVLEGNLTIENIETVKASLIEALNLSAELTVNHNQVREFDLAYLQLLFSAFKASAQLNKKFTLEEGSPEEFLILLKDSGFSNAPYFAPNLSLNK